MNELIEKRIIRKYNEIFENEYFEFEKHFTKIENETFTTKNKTLYFDRKVKYI